MLKNVPAKLGNDSMMMDWYVDGIEVAIKYNNVDGYEYYMRKAFMLAQQLIGFGC